MREININHPLITALTAEKIQKVADEAGVKAILTETKMEGPRKWINEFDISGSPGKVDSFFKRINDLRKD